MTWYLCKFQKIQLPFNYQCHTYLIKSDGVVLYDLIIQKPQNNQSRNGISSFSSPVYDIP